MNRIAKFRDFQRFIRTLNTPKIINVFKVYTGMTLSRIFRIPFVFGGPHTLTAEPTTRCNLACPECPVGTQTLQRAGGEMNLKLFEQVLEESSSTLIHLILYFQGEPFLSQFLIEMIRRAKKMNLYVSTSTNGHYLTGKNISGLLDAGLDRLVVSLDGATPESYRKYRRNGNFHQVTKNLKKLMDERKRRNLNHPYVILQCLIFAHNVDEKDAVIQLGKEMGVDEIQFKTAQFYQLDPSNKMIPKQGSESRYILKEGHYILKGKLINFCRRIWTTAVVTWNGILVPCCFDKNASYPAGEITDHNLMHLWKSERMMNFRKKVLKERKNIDICTNCTEGIRKSNRRK